MTSYVNGSANGRAPRSTGEHRTLPHNLDLEAGVLGGILLDNSRLGELANLEVDDFYNHRNKVVFQAMRNLEAAAVPIDVFTLEHEIEKLGKLEAVGGVAYLGELVLRVPTSDNTQTYAADVQRLHRNRKTIVKIGELLERAYNWPHDPSDMISELAGELQRIEVGRELADRAQSERWCRPLAEYLGDEEPSDDDAEDWIIRDIVPRGEPALWGGPMKSGKTWAALDLCIAVALGQPWLGKFDNTYKQPARVLAVLLEDNVRRLRKRLWELTRSRGTTPNNEDLQEHLRISRSPLRLPDESDQRRLIAEIKKWGAVLVVIDNLTRVMVGDPNGTRDAAAFTRAWTELGDATGASIVFLHHMKKPMGDQNVIDPFDQLRGSGDFGATARNLIVTTPIRNGDSLEKLSEVRMRGNLDLRRESFTLGFARKELLGKTHAWLSDRGDIQTVRDEVKKDLKDAKEKKKRLEFAAELEKRRNLAITIARKEGSVSGMRLANELAMKSPRAVADVLAGLVSSGVLVPAGKRGYELADAERQEHLL